MVKNLSTRNLIILAVFLFSLVSLGFYKYTSIIEERGVQKCEAAMLTDTIDYKDWSAAITDKTVSDFIKDNTYVFKLRDQTRKEVVDEYFKDKELPVENKPSTPPVADPDADARVAKLASRMLEYYCTARPDEVRCHPNSPAK